MKKGKTASKSEAMDVDDAAAKDDEDEFVPATRATKRKRASSTTTKKKKTKKSKSEGEDEPKPKRARKPRTKKESTPPPPNKRPRGWISNKVVLALPEDEEEEEEAEVKVTAVEAGDRWVLVKRHSWSISDDNKPKEKEEEDSAMEEERRVFKYEEPPEDGFCCWDFLPVETMSLIFGYLYGKALRAASLTSTGWRSVAQDHRLWKRLLTRMVATDATKRSFKLYDQNGRLLGDWKDKAGVMVLYDQHSPNFLWNLVLPKEDAASLATPAKEDDGLLKDLEEPPVEKLATLEQKSYSKNMWRWHCIRTKKNKFEGLLFGNIGLVEEAVAHGGQLPDGYRLIWKLIWASQESIQFNAAEQIQQRIPEEAGMIPPQPKRINNVQMYGYQLETLGWLQSMEERIIRKDYFKFSRFAEWKEVDTSLLFDIDNEWFYPQGTNTVSMITKGGIVADEMGLGKTVTMLGLVVSNPQRKIHRMVDQGHHFKLRSRATLVIAPSHLCKEWSNEMEKQMTPQIKLHMVTTMHQVKRLSLWDIMNADVLCISFQLLNNKNYLSLPLNSLVNIRMDDMNLKSPRQDGIRLELFYFHRVIVDEAHEVSLLSPLMAFKSTFRWYVSGTPFPNGLSSVSTALSFLGTDYSDGCKVDIQKPGFMANQVKSLVANHLYIRHIKANVNYSYSLPPLQEKIIFVEQSKLEKGLYDLAKYQRKSETELRKLCGYFDSESRVQTPTLMETIRQSTITELTAKIRTNQDTIARAKLRIEQTEQKIEDLHRIARGEMQRPYYNTDTVPNLRRSIAYTEKQIEETTKDSEELEKFLAYFRQIDCTPLRDLLPKEKGKEKENEKEKEKEKESEAEKTAITPKKRKTPPKLVRSESWRAPSDLEDLVNMYGSKTGHIVMHMREILQEPKNRVIVFSQWDNMLHRISTILSESGIPNAFCQGNVYCRNSAISQFRGEVTKSKKKSSGLVRVLMLSFTNAASGTNLQDATHIVMIDPLGGTKKQAQDIEAQAIGRAHRLGQKNPITLLRFVVKDTIEFELYNRNQ